jgi:hypothetical protein
LVTDSVTGVPLFWLAVIPLQRGEDRTIELKKGAEGMIGRYDAGLTLPPSLLLSSRRRSI